MRYPKGGLHLSREHDYPLLRQLARSAFATHDQLFEFMQLDGCGECRRSFNWRILRLVQHGLVRRQIVAALGAEYIYALTQSGTLRLEGMEDRFVISLSRGRKNGEERSVLHSVELNNIQLSLARSGLSAQWIPEVEIRSENELTNLSYAKDYDAVVGLRVDDRDVKFALEYERTPKSRTEYEEIVNAMKCERHIDQFLYLTANEHLLKFVSWSFRTLERRVYFGLVRDWYRLLLGMPAFSWQAKRYVPLNTLLAQ